MCKLITWYLQVAKQFRDHQPVCLKFSYRTGLQPFSKQRRWFCAENISTGSSSSQTRLGSYLPTLFAPEARSTARICSGYDPAVPMRQSSRKWWGRSRVLSPPALCPISSRMCCSHHGLVLIPPPGEVSTRQGSGSFFITQCRKVPQVWARICSMSPSSGSQSITRGGQGGFPKM